MLTLRINKETKDMIAFLRNHKVKFTPVIRGLIKAELAKICKDFKMKENRIKEAGKQKVLYLPVCAAICTFKNSSFISVYIHTCYKDVI